MGMYSMMKFKLMVKTAVEVDVTFPIYAKHVVEHECGDTTWYRRVTQGPDGILRMVELKVASDFAAPRTQEYELQLTENFLFSESCEIDFVLGRGEYACAPEEFQRAYAEFVDRALKEKFDGTT